ncbi:vWA domain-containing protein [Pelagibacterium xiamenense]|uniref:vWA domain-containing protein n=1 Tax=Pelagibacterium xiamenense TaxID=2901140 RepID=UPI001E480C94|nr:VWA domain-containing protein [Pelagibacterium xiamenense]MCD7060697.1 VWA domain-containing protein [Pelagibacterium xiamenense]
MFHTLRIAVCGLSISLLAVSGASAQAQDIDAAVALVEQFIAAHMTHLDTMQGPLLNDAQAAAPYVLDGLAVDGLQGRLGFDPVYNAQDYEISNIRVFADTDAPFLRGAAQVRVNLENFGQRQDFVYTLVPVPPGNVWQISDIYSVTSDWSLADIAYDLGIDLSGGTGPETTLENVDLPIPCAFACGNPVDDPIVVPGTETIIVPDPVIVPGMEQGDLPGNGINPEGRNLLVILDASGSMWGQIDGVAKITTARQALSGIVGDLDPAMNLGLMAYGHRREGDCADTEILYPVANYDPGRLLPAIEGISPLGKTPIAGALEQAAAAMPASGRPSSVLLISDGLETCGGDPCAAAARLAESGIDTRVHVVGFDLNEEEHAALQCVAENGNGTYYPANDAQSFLTAVNNAIHEAENAISSTPALAPDPAAEIVFEDTFDGPALDTAWRVDNAIDELTTFTPEGALFVAALGDAPYFKNSNATNRFILDRPLPEGDFDLVLEFRMKVQTKHESLLLSLFSAAHEQIGAYMWLEPLGCGNYLNLSLIRLSGSEDDPQTTSFDTSLFSGPWADEVCYDGRARADAIVEALGRDGAQLRLMRRGREITASLELQMPETGETLSYTTEPITMLRLSGAPSLLAGHGHKAQPGESHFEFDRFAIEVPRQ